MMPRAASLWFVLLAGCGAAAPEGPIGETDLGAEIAAASAPEPAMPAAAGAIRRAELDELIARGPGRLLALVVTEPRREGGRFVGFCIVDFTQGPPSAIDLRRGDVILDVNGRRIERPEHLFEVLEQLKTPDRPLSQAARPADHSPSSSRISRAAL
jgi:hypothetical protein